MISIAFATGDQLAQISCLSTIKKGPWLNELYSGLCSIIHIVDHLHIATGDQLTKICCLSTIKKGPWLNELLGEKLKNVFLIFLVSLRNKFPPFLLETGGHSRGPS